MQNGCGANPIDRNITKVVSFPQEQVQVYTPLRIVKGPGERGKWSRLKYLDMSQGHLTHIF
eukprot:4944171-Amphidinium_carterae.1